MPWVFHGFNKKIAVAQKVLQAGAFLSFGAAILNESSTAAAALKHCPEHCFLLETDARSDISIDTIYEKAAHIRNIPIKTLENRLEETVQIIFKIP
jgi:TatD DNase family protein